MNLEKIRKGKRGKSRRIGEGKKECVSEVKMEEEEKERERGSCEFSGEEKEMKKKAVLRLD